MRKVKIAILVMVLCMLCLGGTKADESSILQYAMSAEKDEVEWGDTITLAESLTIHVPADWVKMEEEDPDLEGVGYTGTDSEGNAVALISMRGDATYDSLQLSRKRLEKTGTDYTSTTFHGIDMLIVHGNLTGSGLLEALFCVKDDGTPLIIGFQTVSGDVMQSEKLKKDVTAIVHSVQALDARKLLSFEDTLPGDAAVEAELFSEIDQSKTIIPYGEGNTEMIALLPNELLQDGYGSVANAGRIQMEVFSEEDYNYNLLEDGTAEITGYQGKEDNVEIPTQLGGRAVTSIGERSFSSSNHVVSITIPEGVTKIGDCAFFYCEGLKIVSIPDSIREVGENPFLGCIALQPLEVSSDHAYLATVDGILFSKPDKRLICCPVGYSAVSYEVSQDVEIIGASAFAYCENLKSIAIPESVTEIGNNAFNNCNGLESIVIPDSVINMGEYVFAFCGNLKRVTLPGNMTSLGAMMFYHCDGLTEYVIPDSITAIDTGAFLRCMNLTKVVLHKNVTSIGNDAFMMCYHLEEVNLPDSLGSIGEDAFFDCENLTVRIGQNPYAVHYCAENGIQYVCENGK